MSNLKKMIRVASVKSLITPRLTGWLANHGEGLGTLGMPQKVVRELCTEAGFGEVRKLACSNDFISLFEVRV